MAISSNQFHWDKYNSQFSAEMSDLDNPQFFRIYPDSCDEGISIESERTGAMALFYIVQTNYNPDEPGEITHWDLKPTSESIRRMPGLKGVTMIIFND